MSFDLWPCFYQGTPARLQSAGIIVSCFTLPCADSCVVKRAYIKEHEATSPRYEKFVYLLRTCVSWQGIIYFRNNRIDDGSVPLHVLAFSLFISTAPGRPQLNAIGRDQRPCQGHDP